MVSRMAAPSMKRVGSLFDSTPLRAREVPRHQRKMPTATSHTRAGMVVRDFLASSAAAWVQAGSIRGKAGYISHQTTQARQATAPATFRRTARQATQGSGVANHRRK